MTTRTWRRTLVSRLLYPRTPRRPRSMGICPGCGVMFAAPPGRDEETDEILRVHEAICPGGNRRGDLVTPFA